MELINDRYPSINFAIVISYLHGLPGDKISHPIRNVTMGPLISLMNGNQDVIPS